MGAATHSRQGLPRAGARLSRGACRGMAATQGTARQGFGVTNRRDSWWVAPLLSGLLFTLFVVYSGFSAFLWHPLFGAPIETQGYLSPFFSPLIGPDVLPPGVSALLILWIPLGLRATCYYYRKAYYRFYFADPPGCAVGEPTAHRRFALEEAVPFILQNPHPDILFFSLFPLLFLLNVILLTGYSLSCHSLRHIVGGRVDCFSCTRARRVRYTLWQRLTDLNRNHMWWAWTSLISVTLADVYVRLLTTGVLTDPFI